MQQCVVGKEGALLYCHEQAVMGVCSSSVTKFGDVKLHIGGASMVQLSLFKSQILSVRLHCSFACVSFFSKQG